MFNKSEFEIKLRQEIDPLYDQIERERREDELQIQANAQAGLKYQRVEDKFIHSLIVYSRQTIRPIIRSISENIHFPGLTLITKELDNESLRMQSERRVGYKLFNNRYCLRICVVSTELARTRLQVSLAEDGEELMSEYSDEPIPSPASSAWLYDQAIESTKKLIQACAKQYASAASC